MNLSNILILFALCIGNEGHTEAGESYTILESLNLETLETKYYIRDTMERKWTKLDENKFSLKADDKWVGEMQISTNSTSLLATCKIGEEDFTIQRTGFWKSKVEIKDSKGKIVAKTYNEKWYANSSILEYGNKKYKLILHNNPMAEYAIIEEDKTLLSYGLNHENGNILVRITVNREDSDLLFDFILWYLFVPIVIENTGDNFLFQLMLTAQ